MFKRKLVYLVGLIIFLPFFLLAFQFLEKNYSTFTMRGYSYIYPTESAVNIGQFEELATLAERTETLNYNKSSGQPKVTTRGHPLPGKPRNRSSQPVKKDVFQSRTVKQKITVGQNGQLKTSGVNKSSDGSEVTTRPLYITYDTKGRLGNQMFCYASMLGIAKAQGRAVVLPFYFYLNSTFDLKYIPAKKDPTGWPVIVQSRKTPYDPKLFSLPAVDLIIDGYMQSYKYFESIRQQIHQEFTFLKDIDSAADRILQQILETRKGFTLVGVHVRRGDFLLDQERGYAVPEKTYFIKAFSLMRHKISGSNIVFVVASDDLTWCQNELTGKDVVVLKPEEPSVHLAVLSKCHHVIMSGGTFGWWGGWLAGGHVIYFSRYMGKNTVLGRTFSSQDFFPTHWTPLDN